MDISAAQFHRSGGPTRHLCCDCAAEARRLRPPPIASPGLDICVSALPYAAPWSQWVRSLKYADDIGLAPAMAEACVEALAEARLEIDCLVPVPLSPVRLRGRGYNQAWEIARRVAALLERTALPDALLRVRDTRAQVELGLLARQANLAGAFALNPRHRPRLLGQRVLIVDDVFTTGATLGAAAAALRSAGIGRVSACTFARTPPPEPRSLEVDGCAALVHPASPVTSNS